MGLDIYAGTLTRYYSRNWKTVVQQWAEENGLKPPTARKRCPRQRSKRRWRTGGIKS